MKMKLGKKIAVFTIVTALVVAMLPILAFAGEKVAKIGSTEYETLKDAVDAAQNGDTITLLKDCSGVGIKFTEGKFNTSGLTIDLGGFTYTIGGALVGSTGTVTNGFQLLKNNKITIKNGKINVASTVTGDPANECRILIQNYCDLTLDGVILDGSLLTDSRENRGAYTLSVNNGTTVLKGDTKVIASTKETDKSFAFDTYYYEGYYDIPTVEVEKATINGDVEVSGGKLNLDEGTLTGAIIITSPGTANDVTKGNDFDALPPKYYVWAEGKLILESTIDLGDYKVKTKNKIGGTLEVFKSLEAALDVIKDKTALYLLKDNGEEVTVNRALSFTIFPNGKENKAEIKAGEGFELKIEKDTESPNKSIKYTISAKSVPETADANNWILWAILGFLGLGAAVTVVVRKKEN